MCERSLIRRVIVRQIIVAVSAIVVLSGVVFYQFVESLTVLTDLSLQDQAADIRRVLRVEDGTVSVDLPESVRDFYESGQAGADFVVVDNKTRVLAGSRGAEAPLSVSALKQSVESPVFFEFTNPGQEQPHYGLSEHLNVAGAPLWIQVSQGPEHDDVLADSLIEEFLEDVGWVPLVIAAALCLVTVPTLQHSLRPLRRLSESAARINPRTTEIRLPDQDLPSELVPLVEAVNGAFDRLDQGFRTQRQFTADAAHELRTPLAILSAHAEVLKDYPQGAQLREDVARMARIVEQLLRIARLDSLPLDLSGAVDLKALAIDNATALGPLAVSKGRTIAVSAPEQPVMVAGDGMVLGQALSNLVENALRHSPEGGEVEIVVQANPAPALRVLDAGPGVLEADRPHVFERFWSKSREAASGAGLGLSIVRRIAELHHAKVSVGSAPDGGAEFSIQFPATV